MAQPALAQSTRQQLKTANKLFDQENYRASIPYYEQVLAKEPNNALALFRAGISYMSFDKEKASDYIYKAQKLKPKVSKDVEYWLGRVDHLNYNFDEAITHYQAYNATLKPKDTRKAQLAQLIQHSKNAKVQFNSPKDIFVKNLGPTINTPYSEHSPVISQDDKILLFTSRSDNMSAQSVAQDAKNNKKDKNLATDGQYYENIYEARRIDDENWEKPRSLSTVLNGKGHDASIQVFDNDTKLLMYRNDENGDIMYAEKSGADWTEPKKLNDNINSKAFESDAYITPDGRTIYFSTGKYSEDGTLDIYYATRQQGGDWGTAKPVAGINTKYDDDSPYLSKDGRTLYFASRGHNTMGGYDIFKSEYDSVGNKWGRPENMGYPVNTPDDDTYYRLSPNGSYAYLSSYRIGGYGEKDIYTINYIKNAIIRGKVFSKRDSTTVVPGVELVFSGTQADKTALSYRDVTKPETGDYQVNVLSGRTYQVAASKDGQNVATEEFAVPVSTNDSTVIEKNFYVDYVDTSTVAGVAMKPIYFDTDKYKLRAESITELNNIAAILAANPGVNISIEGHCDSRNTDEYNMVLGQNRANAAYNYLKKQGVGETRMVTVSYGERRPAAGNDTPENMQLNRRVEFRTILKEGEAMPTMTPPAAPTSATPVRTVPLQPGKSKVKMADGTKVKTKVDEDSDKVKVKTKGASDEKSKTVTKDGTIDAKTKDANGEKTKVKTDND
ncbi:OmpA family protein [Hymenobacter yonginensis]|uniref:OmpA family protein n=1 Tax=Hymenobacter yonginensis TaxID=748197 RepID=A0ABY7PSD3_9BACT|nr:OmpA family protein [Hymenobacter yonginensis]WBO85810.1 OmpA family protein [Hymenobacter yonginensis]